MRLREIGSTPKPLCGAIPLHLTPRIPHKIPFKNLEHVLTDSLQKGTPCFQSWVVILCSSDQDASSTTAMHVVMFLGKFGSLWAPGTKVRAKAGRPESTSCTSRSHYFQMYWTFSSAHTRTAWCSSSSQGNNGNRAAGNIVFSQDLSITMQMNNKDRLKT